MRTDFEKLLDEQDARTRAHEARVRRLAVMFDEFDPDRSSRLTLEEIESYMELAIEECNSSVDATIVRHAWELVCLDDPTMA